jgi:hypothetical protein
MTKDEFLWSALRPIDMIMGFMQDLLKEKIINEEEYGTYWPPFVEAYLNLRNFLIEKDKINE